MTNGDYLDWMVTDLDKLATIEARAAIWVQGGGARNFLRVKARRAENDRDQQIFQLAAFIAERHPCVKFPSIIDHENDRADRQDVA